MSQKTIKDKKSGEKDALTKIEVLVGSYNTS